MSLVFSLRLAVVAIGVPLLGAASGCQSDGASDAGEADALSSAPPACPQIIDMSQEGGLHDAALTADQFAKLQDPIASFVLRGDGCPDGFGAIQRKITQNLKKCGADTIATHTISETTNQTRTPSGFRAVVARECQDPEEFGLLVSMFGLGPSTSASEIDAHEVEMIGFDKVAGVFNYYSLEDLSDAGSGVKKKVWRFFGNSHDFVQKKAGGGGFPLQTRRCAGCHVDGGLIQKELESPWIHWNTGGLISTESQGFIAKAPDLLGKERQGSAVQTAIVQPGNRAYAALATTFLKSQGTVDQLLRPLFCTNEINLASDGFGVPEAFFLDQRLQLDFQGHDDLPGVGTTIDKALYAKVTQDVNQRVLDGARKNADGTLSGGRNIGTDTDKGGDTFVYPERSFIDHELVGQLVQQNIIDSRFEHAVSMVDFTRPVFSKARCDLLDRLAPKLASAPKTAQGITAAVKAAIGPSPAEGSADKELLTNLSTSDADLSKRAGAFAKACSARAQSTDAAAREAYARDIQAMLSLKRNTARQLEVLEFSATMPVDDLKVDADAHLDEATCTLTCASPPCAK